MTVKVSHRNINDRVGKDRYRYDQVRNDQVKNDQVRNDRVKNVRVRNDRRSEMKPLYGICIMDYTQKYYSDKI